MPSNTVLTPNIILKEIYTIAHQKSNFIMRTNRQYDGRFANKSQGAIGQSLDIRLPPKYVTRTGNTMAAQNHVERKITLPLATINGIDLNFGQEELTFSIEKFSENILVPAVSQLMATVEGQAAITLYKQVANYSGIVTTASTTVYRDFQNNGRYITDQLAPLAQRTGCLNTQTRVDFSDAVKGLFQDAASIRDQYVEGIVGRTGGFDNYENTLMPTHTSGTFTATTLTVTTTSGSPGVYNGTGNAYSNSAFSVNIDNGGSMTAFSFKAGDIVTFSNVFDVHPETKRSLGYLKRFVIQADVSGTTTGTITILPVPIAVGAYQNVCGAAEAQAGILDNAVMTLLGPATTASAIVYGQNLMFHKDAFVFVTADLEDPSQYGAWGARQVMDGLSVRIWRQGDINNGNFPCRLDIAWGVVAPYPEWACRWVHAQG